MATQSEIWAEIAKNLNIRVVAPFLYQFSGGEAEFAAMLPDFGGGSGIVADPDWDKIQPATDDLNRDGFGYSCIQVDDDANGMIEVLEDWTWTGASGKPDWLTSD